MEQLTLADIDPWLLSGEAVVRLQGRDFDQTADAYAEWLHALGRELSLGIAVLRIADPPGVVVQAFLGDKVPELHDPLLKVARTTCPWLYCPTPKCRNRVGIPGMPCDAHRD